jgi:CHAT domain-containing protein
VCEDIINQTQALHVLADQPACTDAAIGALQRFARANTTAMSDLAAAYYLRAERQDRASDLLRALEAADRAVAADPKLAAARFNRALIQEALGLSTEAIASWDDVRAAGGPGWAAEAARHRERLVRASSVDAAVEWDANQKLLPSALQSRDEARLTRLIAPFPSTALAYFTDQVLQQWAAAPTPEHLDEVRSFANALAQLTKDRYASDVAASVARLQASPQKRALLSKGLIAYGNGHRYESLYRAKDAETSYGEAVKLLDQSDCPISILARLGLAIVVSYDERLPAALSLLESAERLPRQRGYEHLIARIQSNRAWLLFEEGRYVESLAESDKALAAYTRLQDHENIIDTHLASIGALRTAGQYELSWRRAVQTLQDLPRIVLIRRRHALLGDSAATALELGYPRVALQYQNAAFHAIRHDLAATPPENLKQIDVLERNLGVAHRARANIYLRLAQYTQAEEDLKEAIRLTKNSTGADEKPRRSVEARIEEVRGQIALHVDPNQAVAAFSRGLALTPQGVLTTFRANVLVQRAMAQRKLTHDREADDDLHAALDELHAEEHRILENRDRGSDESSWEAYFSRFQDTYRLLIRQEVEEKQPDAAFATAERARAFEPLNLLLQTNVVPSAFRALSAQGEPLGLAEIQKSLPEGTFLLEYCLLEDRMYVWVISSHTFEVVQQPTGRDAVATMVASLQHLVQARDATNMEGALYGLYRTLLAAPMEKVANAQRGQGAFRLVIVPDGAMYGVPFAALRNPSTRRYLVEDAPVSSAGSATLYVFSLLRDRALPRRPDASVLLIGDPAFDPGFALAHGLSRLPGAKREVTDIADMYASHTEVLLDTQATVPRFLGEARKSDVIHVAGHAIANAEAPFRSLLLLAPSPGDPGALDAETLVRKLQLDRTRLVVLSACSSAGGLPIGPEGVAPLVRPLIGAGVPAVVGSLWDIDDATASTLLVSFHRRYRQGSDAAVAMQNAQLDLLRTKKPGLASVLVWAPFEVIGYASSPFGATQAIQGEPP